MNAPLACLVNFPYDLSVQCKWFACPPEHLPWMDEHCDLGDRVPYYDNKLIMHES